MTKSTKNALPLVVFFSEDGDGEDEYLRLIRSAGFETCRPIYSKRDTPDPKLFVGRGKAEELASIIRELKVDVLLVNKNISATQQRNLQKNLDCEVLDWTGLILEIFSQRARSFEGRMQVELAQLQYLSSRLTRGWTHLERQKGGLGLRGPGETQLETDRRLVTRRIRQVNEKLKKIKKQRARSGNARRRGGVPTVALVGYTNAGKSTLFKRLTGVDAHTANQLFVTLDTTVRLLSKVASEKIAISDTVGFIRNLPPTLIAAFSATLEETSEAQLLLHVVDASEEQRDEQIAEVKKVLDSIGASRIPTVMVYNKIDDSCNSDCSIERNRDGEIVGLRVSALNGVGIETLKSAIAEKLSGKKHFLTIRLDTSNAKLRSLFYEWKAVVNEKILEDGDCLMEVSLNKRELRSLEQFKGVYCLINEKSGNASEMAEISEQPLAEDLRLG